MQTVKSSTRTGPPRNMIAHLKRTTRLGFSALVGSAAGFVLAVFVGCALATVPATHADAVTIHVAPVIYATTGN